MPMYEKLYFDNEGVKSFHYLKYTPESEDKQRKLPLVVFMHGAGERGEEDGS